MAWRAHCELGTGMLFRKYGCFLESLVLDNSQEGETKHVGLRSSLQCFSAVTPSDQPLWAIPSSAQSLLFLLIYTFYC